VPQITPRHVLSGLATAVLAGFAVTCSPPTKPGPVVVDVAIQSVSPGAGPATGGTELTIRGAGFSPGAAVTIGGQAAADVTVRGADMITVKTPASTTAGAVDIAVTINGRTGTLANGFRYEVTTNNPPVIKSIAAQGTRLRQPANFADYGEIIVLTAVVEDAEKPPAQLNYQWLACGGTFNGTGAQVQWAAPIGGPPSTCRVELVVSDGSRVATGSVVVRLHNSAAEVGNLAREFLNEFADSTIDAATTVRNFSNSCPGKAAELKDVSDNRRDFIIKSHTYGSATVSVAFGGLCKGKTSDACVVTPVEWTSTVRLTGAIDISKGISTISGVYRDSRWWLCDSLYDGKSSLGLQFLR
jgi:hypothetical protein